MIQRERSQNTDLENVADAILRNDRRTGENTSIRIDLLSERDAIRRDIRRRGLVNRNLVVLEMFMCPAPNPEEQVIRKQEQQHASAVLSRLLAKFERDKTAKAVIFTVILEDISFSKTREIAEVCRIREDIVRAAKERLKYHVRASEKPPYAA